MITAIPLLGNKTGSQQHMFEAYGFLQFSKRESRSLPSKQDKDHFERAAGGQERVDEWFCLRLRSCRRIGVGMSPMALSEMVLKSKIEWPF